MFVLRKEKIFLLKIRCCPDFNCFQSDVVIPVVISGYSIIHGHLIFITKPLYNFLQVYFFPVHQDSGTVDFCGHPDCPGNGNDQ